MPLVRVSNGGWLELLQTVTLTSPSAETRNTRTASATITMTESGLTADNFLLVLKNTTAQLVGGDVTWPSGSITTTISKNYSNKVLTITATWSRGGALHIWFNSQPCTATIDVYRI